MGSNIQTIRQSIPQFMSFIDRVLSVQALTLIVKYNTINTMLQVVSLSSVLLSV